MATTRQRKYHKGDLERPAVWLSGPDPVDHAIYKTWLTSRAQANFRQEGWTISWQEYLDIWRPHWHQRGRASDDLCLTRLDPKQPWDVKNIELITRRVHVQRHNQLTFHRGRKPKVDTE